MGLLGDVLLAPITGPYRGLRSILEIIQQQANDALFDEQRLQEELIALNTRLDLGQVSESEFEAEEAELLERLKAIRQAKQQAQSQDEEG